MYYPRGRRRHFTRDHGLGLLTPAQEKRLRHIIRYHKRRQKRLELDGGEPFKVINARVLLQVHCVLKLHDIPRSHLVHDGTINHAGVAAMMRDLEWYDLTIPEPRSALQVIMTIHEEVYGYKISAGAPAVGLGDYDPSPIADIGYSISTGDTPANNNYVA